MCVAVAERRHQEAAVEIYSWCAGTLSLGTLARRHNFAVDDKDRIGITHPRPDDSTGEQGVCHVVFLPEIIGA